MKKGWKIFWITCGATFAVGIILFVAGLGMGATMEMLKERLPIKEAYSPDIQKSYQDIRELNLDTATGEIKILKAPAGQQNITVETHKISKILKFKCYEEDGVLNIETNEKAWNWLYAKNHAEDAKIYIYIPEDYELEETELNLNAGSIYIEDIHTEQLDIDVDAGEVHAEHFLTNELSMNCDMGTIEVAGKTLGDADLESSVGEIDFTAIGSETDYNYDLNCDIGSIVCGTKEFTELGSEYNIDNQSDKTMSIECGVGEVNVQFQAEQ